MARKRAVKPVTSSEHSGFSLEHHRSEQRRRILIARWFDRQTHSILDADDATIEDAAVTRGIPLVSAVTKGDVVDLCNEHGIEIVDDKYENFDALNEIARQAARLVYTTDPREHATATAEIYHLFAKMGAVTGASAEMLLL